MSILSAYLFLQAGPAPPPRNLAADVAAVVEKYRLPAMGGAVLTGGGPGGIGVSGVREWNRPARVTAGDRWHIGSCTKAMTATLAARLVDRGLLHWSTTIGEIFGTSVPGMHAGWRDVPLLWLLSHRSGASNNPAEESWVRVVRGGGPLRAQRKALVVDALSAPPSNAPNTKTVYSNTGFIIAGAMLEAVADASWEDLMRREVFEPLGMTHSGFGAPGTPGRLDEPLGHVRGDSGWKPVPLGPNADNPAVAGPTGTIHTTLGDWAKFVSAHLQGFAGDESFLTRASWQRLHTPGGADWGYSPGWQVASESWAGDLVLRHLGSNNFWIAEAVLAPRKGIATLVVTNVADDSAEPAFRDLHAVLRTRAR